MKRACAVARMVALAALLGAAPCAYADKQIVAVTGDSFSPPAVTMDQGSR